MFFQISYNKPALYTPTTFNGVIRRLDKILSIKFHEN